MEEYLFFFRMGVYSERLISMDGVIVSKITKVIATIDTVTIISSVFNFLVLNKDKNVIDNSINTFTNLLINSLGLIIIITTKRNVHVSQIYQAYICETCTFLFVVKTFLGKQTINTHNFVQEWRCRYQENLL